MINGSILEAFYGVWGLNQRSLSSNKSDWDIFNNISVRSFFMNTRPRYKIYSCLFGQNDCRREWRMLGTLNGICLSFDANAHYQFDTSDKYELHLLPVHFRFIILIRFSFLMALNYSDITSGWKRNHQGLSVFYNHLTDSTGVSVDGHSVLVNTKASPIVTFQNIKKIHLGKIKK